jgi:threonine dehydrogenase-like Zn-dependent dehydrogenase
VRVLACGVCASELHAVQDEHESYPRLIGHEPVGIMGALLRRTTRPGTRTSA